MVRGQHAFACRLRLPTGPVRLSGELPPARSTEQSLPVHVGRPGPKQLPLSAAFPCAAGLPGHAWRHRFPTRAGEASQFGPATRYGRRPTWPAIAVHADVIWTGTVLPFAEVPDS